MLGLVKLLLGYVFGGGGTITAIVGALERAHVDSLSAKTTEEKIAAQDRIDRLNAALADTRSARQSLGNQPWWMGLIAFMFGFGFALHLLAVCVGTTFAPLLAGGALDWMLHIPKLPPPLDSTELGVVAFFYGYGALTVGATAVAGAIAKRGAR